MDILQDWAQSQLANTTVTDWAQYAYNHVDPKLLLYFTPYTGQLYRLSSWAMPMLKQVMNKPDLTTVVLLLVILFLSLKLLNVMWQATLFWFRMVRRVALWGGLGALGLWFWTRGPDGVVEDVQYWVDVWSNEHKYWREKEHTAKMARKPAYTTQPRAWF